MCGAMTLVVVLFEPSGGIVDDPDWFVRRWLSVLAFARGQHSSLLHDVDLSTYHDFQALPQGRFAHLHTPLHHDIRQLRVAFG